MAYTEPTTTSYGGRLSRSLKGIVGGRIAFIAGTALLFWNEGNYVKTYKALNEAQDATIAVDSVAERDPALNGKVIHASARAETEDILRDPAFDVSVNAISLQRSVEYYQYEERSSTTTEKPRARNSSAADRPAKPPPTTHTSTDSLPTSGGDTDNSGALAR